MRKLVTLVVLAAFGLTVFGGCRVSGEIDKPDSSTSVAR